MAEWISRIDWLLGHTIKAEERLPLRSWGKYCSNASKLELTGIHQPSTFQHVGTYAGMTLTVVVACTLITMELAQSPQPHHHAQRFPATIACLTFSQRSRQQNPWNIIKFFHQIPHTPFKPRTDHPSIDDGPCRRLAECPFVHPSILTRPKAVSPRALQSGVNK